MPENKTTLSSLKNQDWKTVKPEPEKMNGLLTNISANYILKLNVLIYVVVCEKIRVPLKTIEKKSQNPKGGCSDENQKVEIKRLQQQARIILIVYMDFDFK